MPEQEQFTVSVIIKAYNEERHIAAAIESALAALDGMAGEVILADGASTDRTVSIAQRYPIRIVRLDRAADRCCGAGAQLGYQYSAGTFICLMDGDMRLHRDFLHAGLRFLHDNPQVGGVGGALTHRDTANLEYEQRDKRFDPDRQPGRVTRLNGSGLYRRAAIDSADYVTDRNLHGCEELDLAARLQARGWTLAKLDCPAIDHYGHTGNAYKLLLRRIKTRNAWGPGELFRAAIGRPHFSFIIRNDRDLLVCGLTLAWWCCIAAVAVTADRLDAAIGVAVVAAAPFLIMWARWRSFKHAAYSVAVWNALTLCFLPGFLRPRTPPAQWLPSTVIKDFDAIQNFDAVKNLDAIKNLAARAAHWSPMSA
jgi:glycosyltransferase involved in cell wall biosynthesis